MSTRDLREFLLSRLVCVRQHVYRPFQSYSWPSLLICSTTERRGAGIDDDQREHFKHVVGGECDGSTVERDPSWRRDIDY